MYRMSSFRLEIFEELDRLELELELPWGVFNTSDVVGAVMMFEQLAARTGATELLYCDDISFSRS